MDFGGGMWADNRGRVHLGVGEFDVDVVSVTSAFNIALSGMSAASAQLAATANNIANLSTPGYSAQRANLVSAAGGNGVAVASVSAGDSYGWSDGSGSGALGGSGDVTDDLATQAVNLSQAKTLYTANALVLRTADQMTGTLLDILHDDSDSSGGSDSESGS